MSHARATDFGGLGLGLGSQISFHTLPAVITLWRGVFFGKLQRSLARRCSHFGVSYDGGALSSSPRRELARTRPKMTSGWCFTGAALSESCIWLAARRKLVGFIRGVSTILLEDSEVGSNRTRQTEYLCKRNKR